MVAGVKSMTKDEMINQKIAETIKEKFPTIYFYCRKIAAEEIEIELWLTKNQKIQLSKALTEISRATGHRYTKLTYINDDPRDKKAFLGFYSTETVDGELQKRWYYDMISGTLVSFANEVFINHREYEIGDLIEEQS